MEYLQTYGKGLEKDSEVYFYKKFKTHLVSKLKLFRLRLTEVVASDFHEI